MSGLDVFVGADGVGKTNLYRALELLQSAAANTLAEDLAKEGGLTSAPWVGQRKRGEQPELRLEIGLADPEHHAAEAVYRCEVVVGYPACDAGAFEKEPQIKEETVSQVGRTRPYALVERRNHAVKVRGEARDYPTKARSST